jgi:hypothetical protein
MHKYRGFKYIADICDAVNKCKAALAKSNEEVGEVLIRRHQRGHWWSNGGRSEEPAADIPGAANESTSPTNP